LLALEPSREGVAKTILIRSPAVGRILHIYEKSERVVTAGTPLAEIGDPSKIEVVSEILSTDAVKIKQGDKMLIEGWGGDEPLTAKVRLVEPAAFTKISALGIEEQRVNVIADLLDATPSLGNGFRVEVKIVIWESENAVIIPSSALFRNGPKWNVFTVEEGRSRRREVVAGRRSATETQIINGLSEGDTVILHPQNRMEDGTSVEMR
jgi:HlyD family secretion protein